LTYQPPGPNIFGLRFVRSKQFETKEILLLHLADNIHVEPSIFKFDFGNFPFSQKSVFAKKLKNTKGLSIRISFGVREEP
jgi:hypothetical protein